MVLSNNLVKIEKTKPQIIFEPLGKLVTQFTYANIKTHLDLKPLQEEVTGGIFRFRREFAWVGLKNFLGGILYFLITFENGKT